jgi:hypothetical protein
LAERRKIKMLWPSGLDFLLPFGDFSRMKKDTLLDEINRYCAQAGISPSSLGLWALGNSRFVARELRRIEKHKEDAAKLRAYMRDNPAEQRKRAAAE